MPLTTPFATLLVSKNGGATASGAITCAGGDVIQLSAQSMVGWTANPVALWEICGYPPSGFSLPAGWTDSGSGTYFFSGNSNPPPFTLPAASSGWGKFMLRLTACGGKKDGKASSDVIDEATALSVPSPHGLVDVGFDEDNQFDPVRKWIGPLQANLRAIEASIFVSAGTPAVVYRPGAVSPVAPVYSTWAAALAAAQAIGAPVTLVVDDSLAAATVPAGTYDLKLITLSAPVSLNNNVILSLDDNVRFENLTRINGELTIFAAPTSQSVVDEPGVYCFLQEGSQIEVGNTATKPFFKANPTNAILLVLSDDSTLLSDGAMGVIDTGASGSGSAVVVMQDQSQLIGAHVFTGTAGTIEVRVVSPGARGAIGVSFPGNVTVTKGFSVPLAGDVTGTDAASVVAGLTHATSDLIATPSVTSVTTTDGTTAVPLFTITVPSGGVVGIDYTVFAQCTVGAHAGSTWMIRIVGAAADVGGAATVASPSTPTNGILMLASDGTIDATHLSSSASGLVITIKVTGVAANTIKWKHWATIVPVTF